MNKHLKLFNTFAPVHDYLAERYSQDLMYPEKFNTYETFKSTNINFY
jgi:hypothetical protein